MPWASSIAVVLSAALAPAPTPSAGWSEDGSAEAAALRQRVEAHDAAQMESELGQRGLVFVGDPSDPAGSTGTPLDGNATQPADNGEPPGPAVVKLDDLQRQADIERIVRKGRRLFIPGIVLATLGTIFTLGAIAGLAKQPGAASGGFFGASAAIALIGWPMAIAGIRRRRHPEKFLDRQVALTPGGFALRF